MWLGIGWRLGFKKVVEVVAGIGAFLYVAGYLQGKEHFDKRVEEHKQGKDQ